MSPCAPSVSRPPSFCGVSILGLQTAKAAGLQAIITSSSDEKVERARSLGADEKYRTTPDWWDEILRKIDGKGVEVVLEVGGQENHRPFSRLGGVAVSGLGSEINPTSLLFSAKRKAGIFVGSRATLEQTSKFFAGAGIKPVAPIPIRRGERGLPPS